MSSKKKKAGKKNNLPKNDSTAVNLTRRELCNGYIDALTPQNVTNSRKSDGGWMDSIGVHNAGLGHLFEATADPMDKYISNNVSMNLTVVSLLSFVIIIAAQVCSPNNKRATDVTGCNHPY